jgi:hypothetical protein
VHDVADAWAVEHARPQAPQLFVVLVEPQLPELDPAPAPLELDAPLELLPLLDAPLELLPLLLPPLLLLPPPLPLPLPEPVLPAPLDPFTVPELEPPFELLPDPPPDAPDAPP